MSRIYMDGWGEMLIAVGITLVFLVIVAAAMTAAGVWIFS